jgi:hypothetical protein
MFLSLFCSPLSVCQLLLSLNVRDPCCMHFCFFLLVCLAPLSLSLSLSNKQTKQNKHAHTCCLTIQSINFCFPGSAGGASAAFRSNWGKEEEREEEEEDEESEADEEEEREKDEELEEEEDIEEDEEAEKEEEEGTGGGKANTSRT